jgi:hypothetical protein
MPSTVTFSPSDLTLFPGWTSNGVAALTIGRMASELLPVLDNIAGVGAVRLTPPFLYMDFSE